VAAGGLYADLYALQTRSMAEGVLEPTPEPEEARG
jgi:hypothetical protein